MGNQTSRRAPTGSNSSPTTLPTSSITSAGAPPSSPGHRWADASRLPSRRPIRPAPPALGLFDTTAWYNAARQMGGARRDRRDQGPWRDASNSRPRAGSPTRSAPAARTCSTRASRCSSPIRREAYAETCRMLGACNMTAALPRLKMPARIAVGDEDYATPVAMSQTLHRGITGSTLTVIENARHLTPLECPDRIVAELRGAHRNGAGAMIITGELTLPAPRDDRVRACCRTRRSSPPASRACAISRRSTPPITTRCWTPRSPIMKFSFKVSVEVTKLSPPEPHRGQDRGHAARHRRPLHRDLHHRPVEAGNETLVKYSIDANITGKLGSMGQPVLKSKAKEMEQKFVEKMRAAFAGGTAPGAGTHDPVRAGRTRDRRGGAAPARSRRRHGAPARRRHGADADDEGRRVPARPGS